MKACTLRLLLAAALASSGPLWQTKVWSPFRHPFQKRTTTSPLNAVATSTNSCWKEQDQSLLHNVYHPRKLPSQEVDYIIIGIGIGGLWLGACLAKFNITSVVLEQHYIVGGFQPTFWKGAYEFVPGLHYIANLDLCSPLYDMVATPSAILKDEQSTSHDSITYHQAGNSVPSDGSSKVSHELKIGDLPPIAYIHYASQTTEDVLGKLTNDGRLKTDLSAFGGDLGESIGEGSFVMQAAVLGHVLEGCYYPEGGPIQFARGLVPTIRQAGGDVFVKARVEEILVDEDSKVRKVRLANGDVVSSRLGVVSDCGFRSTLRLLPSMTRKKLTRLEEAVEKSSGGISHVFTFVGLNASFEELGLKSSSYHYIPWNTTDETMDAPRFKTTIATRCWTPVLWMYQLVLCLPRQRIRRILPP